MSENENKEPERDEQAEPEKPIRRKRRIFSGRNAVIGLGLVAVLGLVITFGLLFSYKYGVFDNYIKTQFVVKMADIGITFDADVFRVTVNPLAVELQNATFNDKLTGEKLFFVRNAHLDLSVKDLYAWQLTRDITLDKTDINGAEAWVTFDENGRSNFANLHLVENEPGSRVNFKYDSVDFALKDSVVHFGDLSRKISGNARNISFFLSPENASVPTDQMRYKFDFTSRDSNFVYDQSTIEKIDITATGIADKFGADVKSFQLKTPIGESTLVGTLTDWAAPKYNFDIQSTVDLTQASSIMPGGTALTGVGNFKGKVTGEGETYRIEGEADSASLRAEGVYLKGVNVAGTVAGTNTNYEANGKAIAEMLTFEDFRIDALQFMGNVRGTGTDFRWLGELQAAAAKTPHLTLGGLFLSDATAEYRDRVLRAQAKNGRAKKFSIDDREFADVLAANLKIKVENGSVDLSSPSARAASFTTRDYNLRSLSGRNLNVKYKDGRTVVDVDGAQSASANFGNSDLKNVRTDKFHLDVQNGSTKLQATNLRADRADTGAVKVDGINVPEINLEDTGAGTLIYTDRFRVARVETSAVTLGSLNIAGVRLTVKKGTIEGRSDDIDAGDLELAKTKTLPGGGKLNDVKIEHPVFIVEPSGRYRASADMSLGGGIIGSVSLGAANAKVQINNDRVALSDVKGSVMGGSVAGQAEIAFNDRTQSIVKGTFANLDLAKLLALQGGRLAPVIQGQTTGTVDLTFNGTSFRNASGSLNADITANAGKTSSDLIPVTGQVKVTATNGLFNVESGNLNTQNSHLTATGRLDLNDSNSNLALALRSTDASEIERISRVLDLSPALAQQIDSMNAVAAGNLNFDGTLTGNLADPTVNGTASLDSIALRGRNLGRVTTEIFVSPDTGFELRNGKLTESDGGTIAFNVKVPNKGADNTSIQATLTNVDSANLLAALPLDDYIPKSVSDFNAQTSGTVKISGLPNNATGEINLKSAAGSVSGQAFNSFQARALFQGTLINVENFEMATADGFVRAKGTYDRSSTAFDFDLEGKNIQLASLRPWFPNSQEAPEITGTADLTAKATGQTSNSSTFNINFNGIAHTVVVNQNSFGDVAFKGTTANQRLEADLTVSFDGRPQKVTANVNFADANLPFHVETELNQSPLAPYIALVPSLKEYPISGTATGKVEFNGNFSHVDATGKRVYEASNLAGNANFGQLALQLKDTSLTAAEPVVIRFNTREIIFDRARFAGGGSNMTIAGTKALTADGVNNLSINGRVNLNLANLVSKDAFFSGFADVEVRVAGPNSTARLSGTATIDNGAISAFIGNDRVTVDRVKSRIIFTTNQAQIEDATGYLGGGRFKANGGVLLEGLSVNAFRLSLDGDNVTVPLPQDFITTGDAKLEIIGRRYQNSRDLAIQISGSVLAKRSLYTKDIDLANIVGSRRAGSLGSSGDGSIRPLQFDLSIEGRDALVIRNNIADLTASASLRLTGDTANPQISGRITANSGTIFFRKDRYEVQRGVLEFPPDTSIEPIINLQAESEIAGYQVFVSLAGPLTDTELLNATVRSSPALPQADVVSLITTGNLSSAEGGIRTLAQTGINTAAEVLTDSIINNPIRKATDKLFGLNVFEIDPIISGQRLSNTSARLTVGRQINNNLRVTYSTNLSQDQNQVLALEYRISNKMSLVAQYEQRSLSNVTRNRDNFSFEVRFKRRF